MAAPQQRLSIEGGSPRILFWHHFTRGGFGHRRYRTVERYITEKQFIHIHFGDAAVKDQPPVGERFDALEP